MNYFDIIPEVVFEGDKEKGIEPIMDRQEHAPLVRDLENMAQSANIPVHMIWTSMVGICSDKEIEYVRNIRRLRSTYGMVYTGDFNEHPVTKRMMVITGTLLRNYINAKIMTLQDVINALRYDQMPRPTVLLIPNFYTGESIPEWQVTLLTDMLLSRMHHQQQTILYAKNLAQLNSDYSEAVHNHLRDFLLRVKN